MRYLAVGANGLIGLVFLVSSVSKARGPSAVREFVMSVRDMRVLPASLVSPAAALVIVAEFAVWLLLAVPVTAAAMAGLIVAIGLLVLFLVAAGSARRRGAQATCRCFGRPSRVFGPRQVARNVFLVGVAVIGLVAWSTPQKASIGGTLVSLGTGLLFGTVVTILDDLIGLFQPIYTNHSRS